MSEAIETLLASLVGPQGSAVDQSGDLDGHLTAFATVGWRLRGHRPIASPEAVARLAALGVLGVERWSLPDLVRVLMLRRRLAGMADDHAARLVERHVRTGDNAEREAVLKGLMALPVPERFLATAADACRAAVLTTFTAIACDNAYPARHFPDHAFRAMVVKALHLDVPLAGIHGLAGRRDGELARMGADYASERRLAGRPVAADLSLITSPAQELP